MKSCQFLLADIYLIYFSLTQPFKQKDEKLEIRHNWLQSDWNRLLNYKGNGT